MIDFGFDKIALIGAVALIVIGPERLPKVARTVGHLMGKAQRYVADVKAEVNRSMELEELKSMKSTFEDAARGIENSVSGEINQTRADLNDAWSNEAYGSAFGSTTLADLPPNYKHPGKKWRLKRGATPQWYKRQTGVRTHVQSGSARVARFRPPGRTR